MSKTATKDAPDIPELSRQLLQAQEEERGRISRELHDETGQTLMVLRFHLEMLSGDMRNADQKAKIQEARLAPPGAGTGRGHSPAGAIIG